jgi:cytochrome c-type biogenesis protein CcmH/NrfF
LRISAVSLAAVLCAAGAPASGAFAQEHGHGVSSAEEPATQLTPQQRAQYDEALSRVICKCPKENWSKSLSMCPDDCADPQKRQVLARIAEGWSTDRIVDEQVSLYGERASADPGAGQEGSLGLFLAMGAGALAVGLLFAKWSRRAAARRQSAAAHPVAASDAETSAVERELREIE